MAGISLKGIGRLLGIGKDYQIGGKRVTPDPDAMASVGVSALPQGYDPGLEANKTLAQSTPNMVSPMGGRGGVSSIGMRVGGSTPGVGMGTPPMPGMLQEDKTGTTSGASKSSIWGQIIPSVLATGADIYGASRMGKAKDRETAAMEERNRDEVRLREQELEEERKRREEQRIMAMIQAMSSGF